MYAKQVNRFIGQLTGALLLSSVAAIAAAAPIVYTFSGPATGTVGMTDFTNAQVTVTAQGDTGAIVASPGFYCNSLGTVSITIAGVGSFTTVHSNLVFANQGGQVWGFENGTCDVSLDDWLDVDDPNAATYALATNIGPTTGTGRDESPVELTGGIFLTFTASPPTFQARLGTLPTAAATAVPTLDPAALAMLALLVAGGAAFAVRRVKA